MNIDKQALRERYSPKPAPECHICGKEMTIQRMSASRITYGCTGATYDDKGCHYAEGRSIADDHYEQSRVTVVDVSDPDVLALLDELEVTKQERENWRISFDNERYRADKLAAAFNTEHEQLLMANGALITQHMRANTAEKRIAELERANAEQDDHINQQQDRIDELEKGHQEAACSLVEENEELKRKLEAAGKQLVELSGAAGVNSQWKPDVCPVTGRKFFMWIEHETLGYVPTYGGPFDSYTIPLRDSNGEFSCERYDHDFGGWVGGEFIGLHLIDDEEQCRVCELEERIAELEARTVNLPKRSVGEVMHMSGFSRDYAEGWCAGNDNAIHEIRAAGIKVKEE